MPRTDAAVGAESHGLMAVALRRLLAEPRLRHVSVDSDQLVKLHRQILLEKRIMREVFAEFFTAMLAADARWFTAPGARVELGAGSSIFGDLHPQVISTDIKLADTLRAVVDALAMPFKTGAVRSVFGVNCFHHFPDPAKFFGELTAMLAPGGGCVLIEPYHGVVARQFYRRLFETEHFDPDQRGWMTAASGPMTGANQALSYVVFERDRAEFVRRFPALEVVESRPLTNYARYILSGGLNFRALVPAWCAPAIRGAEMALTPAARWLALHHLIVIRRR